MGLTYVERNDVDAAHPIHVLSIQHKQPLTPTNLFNIAQDGFTVFKTSLTKLVLVPQLGELLSEQATDPTTLAIDQKLL